QLSSLGCLPCRCFTPAGQAPSGMGCRPGASTASAGPTARRAAPREGACKELLATQVSRIHLSTPRVALDLRLRSDGGYHVAQDAPQTQGSHGGEGETHAAGRTHPATCGRLLR